MGVGSIQEWHLKYKSGELPPLTNREVEVLKLVFQGMTNKVIANNLCISPMTVKNHVARIIRKMGVKPGGDGRIRCIYEGLRSGILVPPEPNPSGPVYPGVADPKEPIVVLATPPTDAIAEIVRHEAEDWLRLGDLLVSPAWRVARIGDKNVKLYAKEFDLLLTFMTHPLRVMTRDLLLDLTWGSLVVVEARTVDIYIYRLRAVLRACGLDGVIETVRGYGYRLVPLPLPLSLPGKTSTSI